MQWRCIVDGGCTIHYSLITEYGQDLLMGVLHDLWIDSTWQWTTRVVLCVSVHQLHICKVHQCRPFSTVYHTFLDWFPTLQEASGFHFFSTVFYNERKRNSSHFFFRQSYLPRWRQDSWKVRGKKYLCWGRVLQRVLILMDSLKVTLVCTCKVWKSYFTLYFSWTHFENSLCMCIHHTREI